MAKHKVDVSIVGGMFSTLCDLEGVEVDLFPTDDGFARNLGNRRRLRRALERGPSAPVQGVRAGRSAVRIHFLMGLLIRTELRAKTFGRSS